MSASTDGRLLVWDKRQHEKDKTNYIHRKTEFKLLESNIKLKKDDKPKLDANSYELMNASCFEVYNDNPMKYIVGTEQGFIVPLKKTKTVSNQNAPQGKEFSSN